MGSWPLLVCSSPIKERPVKMIFGIVCEPSPCYEIREMRTSLFQERGFDLKIPRIIFQIRDSFWGKFKMCCKRSYLHEYVLNSMDEPRFIWMVPWVLKGPNHIVMCVVC
jgi:hypothetical protein